MQKRLELGSVEPNHERLKKMPKKLKIIRNSFFLIRFGSNRFQFDKHQI
jgi:hypothetical protein